MPTFGRKKGKKSKEKNLDSWVLLEANAIVLLASKIQRFGFFLKRFGFGFEAKFNSVEFDY